MGTPSQVKPQANSIILFDGICNLCSGSVQFIIKRDSKKVFQFAALQSPYGQKQLEKFGLDKNELHSIILVQHDQIYQRSEAILRIAQKLSGPWSLFYVFKILPRFFRDGLYNWIARSRYTFFGKKDSCWLPTADLKSRFLE